MRQIKPTSPNEHYRTQFQALINAKWEETTTKYTIEKETEFESFIFDPIEVRINHALDRTTGEKQGDDFREIIFKDIDMNVEKGLYYIFDDCYWLTINTDEYNRTSKNIIIRRCNNFLRYRDKNDDSIVEIPCILGYDVSSPSPQVDNDIITPNNHVVITVQGSAKVKEIAKANMRFIFGNRPFKITGYNNVMQNGIIDTGTPLVYIDAYLDRVSPYDDLEKGIAYNYNNNYSIVINQKNFSEVKDFSTALTATVYNNGKVVEREITWYSSDENVIKITQNGEITLIGEIGQEGIITAQLGQNKDVYDNIHINIVENVVNEPYIVIDPMITNLSQYSEVEFEANVYVGDKKQSTTVNVTPSGADMTTYSLYVLGNNKFRLHCDNVSKIPLLLTFRADDIYTQMAINLTSMF